MTRRRATPRDETRHVAALLLLQQMNSVLHTLRPRDAEVIALLYGLRDGLARSRADVAASLDLTRDEVRQIESRAMSSLRHPTRAQVVRDYLDGPGHVLVPDAVRAQLLGRPEPHWTTGHCDRHGAWRAVITSLVTCAVCPCPLTPQGPVTTRSTIKEFGRPRRYCSDACRQAAYRQRVQARKTTATGELPVREDPP
ncbi:sigma factor-like helix-turn-helix DNA-binding protein [Kutzneria buriramensis]|uniref:Sigma-70-like protein n=1 Tax=Kutzneria buriramensis TaxID=1045776 RepID=A0A3E0GVL7_9PSEU|nr:sigma factor-like helix-turn-helix DNA-binding protein [Kutzneria buriramensis]REH30709.1 sigma-70-like protein [Kutzneria buriramensis]